MSIPKFDTSRWPGLLCITYTPDFAIEDVEAFSERLAQFCAEENACPFVGVVDLSQTSFERIPVKMRERLATSIDAVKMRYPQRMIGEGIVSPSLALRGVVKAYTWIRRIRNEVKCFATTQEAIKWASEYHERHCMRAITSRIRSLKDARPDSDALAEDQVDDHASAERSHDRA